MINRRGYTLIELMMVTVIISILLSIGLTRFGAVMRKSRDGATHGNLGAIRSAISIYYSNVLNLYPADVAMLTVNAAYIKAIPQTQMKEYHGASSAIKYVSGANNIDDGAGWAYNNDPTQTTYGKVWINCTHTDAKGSIWSAY